MKWGLALLVLAACGGRTGLRDAALDAGTSPEAGPVAYKVVYTPPGNGLAVWRSTTGASENVPGPSYESMELSCTYDGRFCGVEDDLLRSFDVLEASGSVVRTQNGFLHALRPDGARAIVDGVHDGCIGTLDVDATYADVWCGDEHVEAWRAVAYAPDGKTVLWRHEVYATNSTTFETATEQLSGERIILAPGVGRRILSPAFSFDGSRIAYSDCQWAYDSAYCRITTIRLDTLEASTVVDPERFIPAAGFTPDGSGIVYFESAHHADLGSPMKLRLVVVATGAMETLIDAPPLLVQLPPLLCVARDP